MALETTPVLIVTRPGAAAQDFARAAVRGFAVRTLISPVMGIDPVEPGPLPTPVGAVVLSSAHGAERACQLGLPEGLPAYCVGPRTTRAARDGGFSAEETGPTAEALVQVLSERAVPGPLLHLRGRHTRGEVAARLTAAGRDCAERVVYDQVAVPLSGAAQAALRGSAPVVLPLFSPRTAVLLSEMAEPGASRHVVAISDEVARQAAALGPASLHRADTPDGAAMLRATRGVLDWLESREVAG